MSVQNFVKLKPAKILNLKSSKFWRKVGGGEVSERILEVKFTRILNFKSAKILNLKSAKILGGCQFKNYGGQTCKNSEPQICKNYNR